MRSLVSPLLLALAACSADPAPAPLLRIDDLTDAESCAAGGVAVHLGPDTDADGTLDDEEITQTSVVCDGADGQTPQVEDGLAALVSVEPATTSDCPSGDGGVIVRAGVDHNANRVLDPEEVDDRATLCSGRDGDDGADGATGADGAAGSDGTPGVDGAPGADGQSAVISTTRFESDPGCPGGGARVAAGLDVDGDGALAAEEETSAVVVCDAATPLVGPVLEGSFTVENAGDVARLAGVQQITGTLSITGAGLTSVALPDLSEVGSVHLDAPDLVSVDAPALASVHGAVVITRPIDLPALQSVDGDVWYGSEGPEPLPGLSGLVSVGGTLTLETPDETTVPAFDALTTVGGLSITTGGVALDGFHALTTVAGDLDVAGDLLTTFSAFDSLSSVGGDLWLFVGELTEIDAFPALEQVDGTITISGGALTALDGFGALAAAGALVLWGVGVSDVSGFPSLLEITEGDLYVASSSAADVSGFGSLTRVAGNIDLSYLPSLTQVSGFGALTEVGGGLWLDGNEALESVDGFVGLTTIGATLDLSWTPSLTDVDFPALTTVAGPLLLQGGTGLLYLSGFDLVTQLGGLDVSDASNLEAISGFGALTRVTGHVTIADNPALTSIAGFEAVSTVGGDLWLANLDALQDWSAFSSATEIDGSLYVAEAGALSGFALPALTSVHGDVSFSAPVTSLDLTALSTVGGDLTVRDTEECEATLAVWAASITVGGDVDLGDNAECLDVE